MATVTQQDLQRDPLLLLQRAESGELIVVTRDDRPVAELRPISPPHATPRPYGLAAGDFVVPGEFDAPLPDDVVRAFEAR